MSNSILSVSEAQNLILNHTFKPETEIIPMVKSLGRVLTEPIYADRHYPPFNRAAVDGFAINSLYFSANKTFEIAGQVLAGQVWEGPDETNKAIKVMTGAPVPEFMDIMIRVEDAITTNNTVSFKISETKAWQNIAIKGEDLKTGDLVIPENHAINWITYAALSVLGITTVKVYKPLSIKIISTGDEVVEPGQDILAHQIRNSNAYSIEGFLAKYQIIPTEKLLVGDNPDELYQAFSNQQTDITIISGGVSMGDADFVPSMLQKAGFTQLFHKTAIKPGKPIWVGFKQGKMVFALPGNPVSVQVSLKIFVEPFIRKCLGLEPKNPIKLPFSGNRTKKGTLQEYFPVKINSDSTLATVKSNGSGDIKATLFSDGIAMHPAEKTQISQGDLLEFYPW